MFYEGSTFLLAFLLGDFLTGGRFDLYPNYQALGDCEPIDWWHSGQL